MRTTNAKTKTTTKSTKATKTTKATKKATSSANTKKTTSTKKEQNKSFFNSATKLTLRLAMAKTFDYYDDNFNMQTGVNYIGVDAEGNEYWCNCLDKRIAVNSQYAKSKQYVTIIVDIKGTHQYNEEEQIDIDLISTISIDDYLE